MKILTLVLWKFFVLRKVCLFILVYVQGVPRSVYSLDLLPVVYIGPDQTRPGFRYHDENMFFSSF